jgi:alkaline phosphatase
LKVLSAEEREALQALADEGDAEAAAELGLVLSDLELSVLQEAFARSMLGEEERSEDEHTYLLYGGYEPLTVKLTTILNQKAGIAWTSYSHTGIPVQTSAVGVGAEQFNGFYDQTDIFTYMMTVAAFE